MGGGEASRRGSGRLPVLSYLALTHLANDVLTGMVPAMLPLLQAAFHVGYAALGAVVLTTNVTSALTQPLFGLASDRRPRPWLIPLGPLLAGAGLLAVALVPSYGWVVLAVACSGLGPAAFHPEASRAASLVADPESRGAAQAVFQVGGNLGFALAPLLLSLLALHRGRAGLALFFPLGLLAVALWLPYRRHLAAAVAEQARRARHAPERRAPRGALWALVLLNGAVTLRSFAQLGLTSFLPLYFARRVTDGVAFGELLAFLFLLAGALGTFLGGVISDRLGSVRVVRFSFWLSIPLLAAFPHLGGRLYPALDLVLLGVAVLSTFSVTVVLGQQYLPDKLAMVSGLMIGFSIGTGGLGAVLLGALADRFGLEAVMRGLWVIPLLAAAVSQLLPEPRAEAAG